MSSLHHIFTVKRGDKLVHLVSKKFGIQAEIPAMHFNLPKQVFAEIYLLECQRASDEMLNSIMKEWEAQNGA
jgi:hypothetical protein